MVKPFVRRAAILAAGLTLVFAVSSSAFATPQVQLKVFMLNTGVQPHAAGRLMFVSNPAQKFFMINLTGMTPGAYDVVLESAIVDSITVGSDGSGHLLHRSRTRSKSGPQPLPYDPRGGHLEIQAAGVVILTTDVPSDPAQAQLRILIHLDLTNLGVQPDATAGAVLTGRFGRLQFDVEMEHAIPGSYDLMVDSVKVATITVGANGWGQVRFDSRPSSDGSGDDSLDLLLTFDPRGKSLSIMQGAVPLFDGTFPLL